MIQFLSPISFLALLALMIPIAIHLLNRKAGRTIKIGSIRFLQASESSRFRSLKLSEIALLLVRVGLIAILTILLAEPTWLSKNPNSRNKNGWVLISPELIKKPLNVETTRAVDSLVADGNELRLFAANFPKITLEDSPASSNPDENNWSLIREAEKIAPPNSEFWVFAPNRLTSFRGERPTLHSKVHWYLSDVLSQNRWIHEAKMFHDDSLKIVVGFSDSSNTFLSHYFLKPSKKQEILSADGLPPVEFTPARENDDSSVKLIQQDAIPEDNLDKVQIEDAFNILILHDESRKDDASYLEAALGVVFDYTHNAGAVQSRLIESEPAALENINMLIWLASHPVSQNILEEMGQETAMLFDAGSEYLTTQSQLLIDEEKGTEMPRLFRRAQSKDWGTALWWDGFGEPVLGYQHKGNAIHLQFYSRFHPSWSEMVLHPEFPEIMLSLLKFVKNPFGNDNSNTNRSDQRQIAESQLLSDQNEVVESDMISAKHSLHFPIWIIAVLLFLVERSVSERKHN